MKVLLDFLALILFFAVYYFTHNLYIATALAIIAGILQVAFLYFSHKKIDMMQWVSLVLIIVFGGATLLLHNPLFIKWKPTLLFGFIGVAIGGGLLFQKNILRQLIGQGITAPDHVWRNLSLVWCVFFIYLGVANLWVAYHFSEEFWVSYKVFGTIGQMVLFLIVQSIYMARYIKEEQ